jgi:hypothetical protein
MTTIRIQIPQSSWRLRPVPKLDENGKPLTNVYQCSMCLKYEIPHFVIEVAGPATDHRSCWGSGVATYQRCCTHCGRRDGPWVSAKDVGGWY